MDTKQANEIAAIAGKAASEAAAQVAGDLVKQIPELVDKMLTSRLDQIGMTQPAGVAQSPPTSGGTAGILQSLAPLLMQQIVKPEQVNPIEALVKQIDTVGALVSAIDRIRTPLNQTPAERLPANTALAWTKLGYRLAQEGKPLPEFDSAKVTTPPGEMV